MNGSDFLLDTNVVVGYLGGQEWAVSFMGEQSAAGATFAVSQITRMELLCHAAITAEEEQAVRRFLSHVRVVGLSDSVERCAIRVRRTRRIKLPDAIIVATAIELGATLVTCDADLTALDLPGLKLLPPGQVHRRVGR